jgi:hypothetical protein
MGTVNPHKAGLVGAALLGGWHFLWALLVALGWAQALINFVFWLHFINPIYVIAPFKAGVALLLIIVTAAIGYTIGSILGVLWNRIHR